MLPVTLEELAVTEVQEGAEDEEAQPTVKMEVVQILVEMGEMDLLEVLEEVLTQILVVHLVEMGEMVQVLLDS